MAKKDDNYEYHKQNDYPGERVAEKKRVADRKATADKRADARVAAKGRRKDAKMDSEVRRSDNKAARVNRKRDAADAVGLAVVIGLIIIILAGSVWGYMTVQKQSEEIDAQAEEINNLRLNSNNTETMQTDDVRQAQLYQEFVVTTNNVRREIAALEDYDIIYSNMYQLCSGLTERENNVNHALYRFAQEEIEYYEQIAILTDKPECENEIETMRSAMQESRVADERLYVLTKNLCHEITDNEIAYTTKEETGWNLAREDAENKAETFDDAERSVIECFN